MTLAVIGAGLGRTGTLSTKIALEQLGISPCHHMDDVFASPERLQIWQAIAEDGPVDWHEVFANYEATIDWPSTNYWRELADAFLPFQVAERATRLVAGRGQGVELAA